MATFQRLFFLAQIVQGGLFFLRCFIDIREGVLRLCQLRFESRFLGKLGIDVPDSVFQLGGIRFMLFRRAL